MNVRDITNVVDFSPFTIPAEWYEAEPARGAILLVPALGTAARYYRPFASACAHRGYAVLLPELPGTGASRPRPSRRIDYGYRDLAERYLPAMVEAVRERCGNAPVIVVGHSIGAHAGMLAILQNKIAVDALVTVAGGNIHYRNWAGHGAAQVRLMAWIVAGLSSFLGFVPGRYLGLGGPQPGTLMREWSRTIHHGGYAHIGSLLSSAAPMPVLCIGYEGDFMAPRKSVAGLAHQLGGEMEWVMVEWPGNPHASWARHPEKTLEVIDEWLASRRVVPVA